MGKKKIILYIVILLIFVRLTGTEVQAFEADISLSKVFLRHDEGYFGKIHLDLIETQGFYLEILQVGQYYQQTGLGLEYRVMKRSQAEIWLSIGHEEYELLKVKNTFGRTGIRVKAPVADVDLSLSADLMMDDIVGVFLRYQLELRLPRNWLQANIGFGNLFGSEDGYAFWVGFNL